MRSPGKLRIGEVGPDDAAELYWNMREPDWREVVASHGIDVLRTIEQAIAHSTHALAIRDAAGALLCLLGAVPISLLGGMASPWMLGTAALDDHPCSLARVARRYFSEVARVYPVLENHVDVRNTASIKLLDWLGCSFDEPRPYGVAGLPFMRFEYRSS